MLSYRNRLQLVELAAIGVPMVLVFAGRAALSTPPPIAATVPVNAPVVTAPPVVPTKPLTPEQVKAAEWVRQLPQALALVSPLNHPIEVVQVPTTLPEPEPEVVEAPPPPPRINPVNGLRLSAVLGNDDGQLASINGKIFRIGEDVRRGLKLTAIDPRGSVVTLTDLHGQTYQLKREEPK